MIKLNERYIVDQKGNQIGVLLDLKDYKYILEELEELETLRAYDQAKADDDEIIPFEDAILEIEAQRQ